MFKHSHCGGSHTTVQEARDCQAQPAGTRSLINAGAVYSEAVARLARQTPHPAVTNITNRHSAPPAWSSNRATDRQVSYLKDLINKRCAERAPIDVVETAMHVMEGKPISFDEARKAIEAIKAQPYRTEETPAQPASAPPLPPQATRPNVKALKAQVPDGRYAVNVPGFGQDKLQFFFVRINRRGYVRIDQVVSDSRMPVAFSKYADVLRAIIDAGIAETGKAYADNMGQCFKCGRALTDPDNAYKPFGLGPDCGPKVMGGL